MSENEKEYSFLYLVDWGNCYLGGYDEDFTQIFNTLQKTVYDDLKRLGVRDIKIITPKELDKLRGYYHKPSMQEFSASTIEICDVVVTRYRRKVVKQ